MTTYSISQYKNRAEFIDQIHRDYKIGGIKLVRDQLQRLEWLYLMGMYDTMFMKEDTKQTQ